MVQRSNATEEDHDANDTSRCFVKRSAVLFFVSTRLTDLQNVFCFRKIDQLRMLLHLGFSTIFIVYFFIVCRIVTTFDCRPTLSARCHATGTDESPEEDHEVCPLGKPSVLNSHHHIWSHYLELPSTTLFVGLHPVIICALVLFLGTHRVERTSCTCGLFRFLVIDRIASWLF